ncbi:MAG: Cys-tRNA(Pro) deacylase [Myxococcales bacterium]|nr:Cys-tRNA(Pro) deacylase [Myxococcales bacterium]
MSSLGEKDLQQRGYSFTSHPYDYRKKGAEAAAEALGFPLEQMLKTLVLELSDGRFIFLMAPGHLAVSLRDVSRQLQVKGAEMAAERDILRLTGYTPGGIGPFGSRTPLPVFIDLFALEVPIVYFNGGRRGLLLGMDPEELVEAAQAEIVDVTRQ